MINFFNENQTLILSIAIFLLCVIIGFFADKSMNKDANNKKEIISSSEDKKENNINNSNKQNSSNPPVFDKTISSDDEFGNMF